MQSKLRPAPFTQPNKVTSATISIPRPILTATHVRIEAKATAPASQSIDCAASLKRCSPVCFADISNAAIPLPAGTSREQLLARFHVQGRDGQLLSGAKAFLALWAELPGWRWLALAGRLPGANWVMERMYRLFLRWRPTLQRWAARWD